jgi:hypothetical protein
MNNAHYCHDWDGICVQGKYPSHVKKRIRGTLLAHTIDDLLSLPSAPKEWYQLKNTGIVKRIKSEIK